MSEKFRQYNLIETLSKKYSHTTYLASPIDGPERQVVLTIFSPSLFRFPHERESLLQKAQRIKQLQHPYLVSLLETGIEKEQPFVVREYLPHGSLRSDLKKISPKRLLLRDALNIVLQVGEALVYAHGHNIIHGNVKPENILLESNGQALLADFHLVSRKDALVRDQASEEYAFCYLAPEQFAGVCDARSDQYSLGCVAYELITGRVPFSPQTLTSMMGHSNYEQPAPLSESVVDLPPSLESAVLKALAQDPEERFLDFSLFLDVVKSALSPPPAFPLARTAHSSKNRVSDPPAQSREARTISSPINNHAVLPDSLSQSSEIARVSNSVKVDTARSKHTSSTAPASMPESPEMVSLSESLENVLQSRRFPFSLSGQAYPIGGTEGEKEVEDLLMTNPFGQEKDEENDDEDSLIDECFVQEKEQDEWSVMASAFAHDVPDEEGVMSHDEDGLRSVWPRRGKSKGLGAILLVSGLVALILYVFLPMVRDASNTSPQVTSKKQVAVPQVTSISTGQIPAQVVIIPTAQPSVQATAKVTATAILQSVLQSQSVAPSHVRNNPPLLSPTPTPTPVPTPTPTPTPAVTSGSTTYEAEASQNTLSGGASIISCNTCSGGYRVGYLGLNNGNNATLTYHNVYAASTGSYTLSLYYSNGNSSDEYEYISVNGAAAIVFDGAPTGSFSTVATASIAVNLNAGGNTISFSNPQGSAPDIDKIVV
jgi:serine/threonine protein kinase